MRPFVHRLDREFEQGALGQHSLPELHLDIEGFLRRLRRQRLVLLGAGVISIVAGMVWLLLATPLYTADTLVLIDNRRIHAVQDSYDAQSQVPELAGSLIDSQVEIVKSEKLAQLVVNRLNLLEDPKFNVPDRLGLFLSLRQTLADLFSFWRAKKSSIAATSGEDIRLRRAVDLLRLNLDPRRVGR